MKSVLHILSMTLSAILHPLFMPTYGMVCFCAAFNSTQVPLPRVYWLVACSGTFVITALIPLSLMLIRRWRGTISDISISNAPERTPVYLYTLICYACWCYFLYKIIYAPFVSLIGVGATIALGLILLINSRWKISAHLSGLGGLLGGVLAYTFNYSLPLPIGTIAVILGLALVLMYARLYLNAHTPLQVIAGFILGIIMTFTPTYLIGIL